MSMATMTKEIRTYSRNHILKSSKKMRHNPIMGLFLWRVISINCQILFRASLQHKYCQVKSRRDCHNKLKNSIPTDTILDHHLIQALKIHHMHQEFPSVISRTLKLLALKLLALTLKTLLDIKHPCNNRIILHNRMQCHNRILCLKVVTLLAHSIPQLVTLIITKQATVCMIQEVYHRQGPIVKRSYLQSHLKIKMALSILQYRKDYNSSTLISGQIRINFQDSSNKITILNSHTSKTHSRAYPSKTTKKGKVAEVTLY